MAVRQLSHKLGEAVQSFWDVLESAYYGRFTLHQDGASPISQLFKVATALTIAMTASVLTSAIALPLVLPVVVCWCLVAPCTGRPARRFQSIFETCAAGSLIPFVCLWCTSVALYRVTQLLCHSVPKSICRSWAAVRRKVEKTLHPVRAHSDEVVLPLYRTQLPVVDASTPSPPQTTSPNVSTRTASKMLMRYATRRPRAFRFLNLPPELRNAVYRQALEPYKVLHCFPTRLLRANKEFTNAVSLLRTCHQIRNEASTYFYNTTTFKVWSRYPFYRNIDPLMTKKIRELNFVAFPNSRGFNGLSRILYWDLRRMSSLRSLTITCHDSDFGKYGDLMQESLKTMKETYCRQLMRVAIAVLIPIRATTAHVNAIREQLRTRLSYVQPAWGRKSRLSVTLDIRVKVPKCTAYIGELVAHGCPRGPLRSEMHPSRMT